ncbi:MAG TPA: radical SAM protein [Ktedonobacteraceae bacterium]|nr:radical SAM protein [Ktedonobacteraceae bacterium]
MNRGTRMQKRILFTVEKNRVLVPVGEPCPFGCRYCYTRGGEVGLSRVSAEDILSRFRQFALENPFETIQFGYDGDPFARPERGIAMLKQLAAMHKHINFSTKALLEGSILDALSDIHRSMKLAGTALSVQISLSCWDSASIVEPHTPSPSERILTIANLKSIDIPAFIAVRPVLPHIHDSEYERIAEEGIDAGCVGFVLGPLYADMRGQFVRFIPPGDLANVPSQTGSVSWSAHAPRWTRYEDTDRLHRLIQMIERKGGRTFLSSADVVALVPRKERVA